MSATPLASEQESDELASALAAAAPFADLPAPVIKAIADASMERMFAAGETIVSFGQHDGAEFYYVVRGKLKAALADEITRAVLVEEVPAGKFFGLADAMAETAASAAEKLTLTAETDATVIAIEAAAFRGVVAQRPSLTRSLMHYFAKLLSSYGIQEAAGDSPLRRVFAALMTHVERDALTGEWRIPRMPKHREIAEEAGADENVAAAAVARLIQDGVARRDYPGLIIDDMAEFSRLAN